MTSVLKEPLRISSALRNYTYGYASPPLTFGDSDMVVPTSPTMLTPVLNTAMMEVITRSGPDFFNAEGSKLVDDSSDDNMNLMDVYSETLHHEVKEDEFGLPPDPWTTRKNGTDSDDVQALAEQSGMSLDHAFGLMLGGTTGHSMVTAPTPQTSPDPTGAGPAVTSTTVRGINFTSTESITLFDTADMDDSVDEDDNHSDNDNEEDEGDDDELSHTRASSLEEYEEDRVSAEDDDAQDTQDNGRSLRRGCRARRPPGSFKFSPSASPVPSGQSRRSNSARRHMSTLSSNRGGAAAAKKSASKAAMVKARAMAVVTENGRIRKRPTTSMPVEERVIYIFGEEALRLDRDSFKIWSGAVTLPDLTSTEKQVFKRVRRRLLGRTYAKRSRDRQVQQTSAIEEECDNLRQENNELHDRIARLCAIYPDELAGIRVPRRS
eukprot:m.31654 g.31654  ORF g.31654 m.31654 type:complete len:435 (+) comp4821_c0_seq2:526-1830(+)